MFAGVAITCLTSHYSCVSYQDILPSSTRLAKYCHFRLLTKQDSDGCDAKPRDFKNESRNQWVAL